MFKYLLLVFTIISLANMALGGFISAYATCMAACLTTCPMCYLLCEAACEGLTCVVAALPVP